MKKKPFIVILSIMLSILCTTATIAPTNAFAATTSKTSTAKKSTKKKTSTKKVAVKKSVDLNPPLITLATAPHSPKPVAKTKKKTTKKKTTKTKKA